MKVRENFLLAHYILGYVNPVRALGLSHLSMGRIHRYRGLSHHAGKQHIYFIFTCDTEYTPPWESGSWIRTGSDGRTWTGLMNLQELFKLYSIKGTFLLEGILAKNDPELVRFLFGNEHEIGYHGFAHESYGGYWRTRTVEQPRILSKTEVEQRIIRGKEILTDLTGLRPTSFVAPFHHIRKSTISILTREGFTVDSSIYNHVYGEIEPVKLQTKPNETIIEIPFAVPFRPLWRMSVSPFFPTLLESLSIDFDRTISDLQTQVDCLASRDRPLIYLLTCHPWEYSDKNSLAFRTLRKFVNYLTSYERAEFITMNQAPYYLKSLSVTNI